MRHFTIATEPVFGYRTTAFSERMVLVFLLMYATSSALAGIPAGADIDDAVSADVTPEGFQAIAEMLPAFLPS